MAVRPDEYAVADDLVRALHAGDVEGLPAFTQVSWRPNPQDPPDVILDIDGREVGVELGRIVGEDYAKVHRLQPRLHDWEPQPEDNVERVFRKKAGSYTRRGLQVDWLVLHNSLVEVPGFYDGGLEWHRHLRSAKARLFATGPFDKVLLQSEWNGQSWWSVVFATDGNQIDTPAEARLCEWRNRFAADGRVLVDDIAVDDQGDLRAFPVEGQGLLVYQDSCMAISQVVRVADNPRERIRGLTFSGWWYRVWLPCRSQQDAAALADELEVERRP